MRRLAIALLPALAFVASPVAAEDHPDLTGFWGPGPIDAERPQDMLDKLPDGTVMVDDTGFVEFTRGDFGALILKPEALEKAMEWQAQDDMTIGRVCLPPSIVYGLQGPFPLEIVQLTDVVIFRHEYFDQVRLVYMDGREHPGEDYPHSKVGFSTGHWDGDELVVETTHIAASTITNNGLDHTDDVVTFERYRLSEDGSQLMATQWFSDRNVLENDGARFIVWQKRDDNVYPYECDPSFAVEYQDMVDESGSLPATSDQVGRP